MSDVSNPFSLFAEWFAAARKSEPNDPDAGALGTVDAEGQPNVRMVLIKEADPRGFVFYTNCESDKGRELAANPRAALCLHWKSLRRQVRIQGRVETIEAADADAYFAGRPRDAQISAWASRQSRALASRLELEKAVADTAAKFADRAVPRPPNWLGYRIVPARIEFWESRPNRLHDRLLFVREGGRWAARRLYP
jgi:pyridoxamine 5'-phosphate oxidase